MTSPELRRRLLRVGTAEKKTIDNFLEGASHTLAFGQSIDDILKQAAIDRLKLGQQFLRVAGRISNTSRPDWRSVIGRHYYAMYHSMRAVAYFAHGGDDYQEHNKLPSGVPGDFPERDLRANELKDARSRRNEADYDLYPGGTPYFRRNARSLAPVAIRFVDECQQYLGRKGCEF